jgi:hypothetical protein
MTWNQCEGNLGKGKKGAEHGLGLTVYVCFSACGSTDDYGEQRMLSANDVFVKLFSVQHQILPKQQKINKQICWLH